VTTYEEWRVTGTYNGRPLDIIWVPAHADPIRPPAHADVVLSHDPGGDAKTYLRVQAYPSGGPSRNTWADGPHLHRRTVTVTDWQGAEA